MKHMEKNNTKYMKMLNQAEKTEEKSTKIKRKKRNRTKEKQ